jgi:uncharacterized hydrophobic protein (TIGR00271 family)
VIAFEISGATPAMSDVAQRILELEGIGRVRIVPALPDGRSLVSGEVRHDATDRLVDELLAFGLTSEDLRLTRVEELGGGQLGAEDTSLIWADVVGLAGSNSRIVSRYLALMAVAGVIACYGVVDSNPLLVVGAMAVSPDLLPITATAVGLVGRSFRLSARALFTLAIGMAVVSLFAAIFAFAQNELSLLPSAFNIDATILRGLAHVDDETIVVAFVAGVAGMLSFETRASSGVGVAISVTTVPAAAYLGIAVGLGDSSKVLGALAVLSANVALIVTGAAITLILQRTLASRRRGR